mmetsp:Transcript_1199/g.3454  ORF Transcript_1199/g.3454 Transcript_1199/m.3454 type:complete len:372 (+) Transcript_1199:79-1194(+)
MSRVATREDEGSSHSRWLLPLMFVSSTLLVLWSLSKSNTIPPLDHRNGNFVRDPRNKANNHWVEEEPLFGSDRVWENEGWDSPPAEGTCRHTKFQPFKTGCPITCCGYRDSGFKTMQQPMYRFGLVWDFGKLFAEMHDYDALSRAYASDAELQEKLNVSATMARLFAKSESVLATNANSALKPKVQNYMHVALSYFCCMTEAEAKRALVYVREYVARAASEAKIQHLTFRFARLECWRERLDYATTALVLDNATQRKLLTLHDDVNAYVRRRATDKETRLQVAQTFETMPKRSDQMPFHVTLLGLSAPSDAATFQTGNVSKYLPSIASAVSKVNAQVSDLYTDSNAVSPIRTLDLRTTALFCHANCDVGRS